MSGQDYEVSWSVNVSAEDPLDAIRQARDMALDPRTSATVWVAYDQNGDKTVVDMYCPEDPAFILGGPEEET